jgi:hypothetical protein
MYVQDFFSLLQPLSRFLTFKISTVREVHQTCGRFVITECTLPGHHFSNIVVNYKWNPYQADKSSTCLDL